MTKEQIIGALKAAAKPYEEYYIDDEVVDAINTYSCLLYTSDAADE